MKQLSAGVARVFLLIMVFVGVSAVQTSAWARAPEPGDKVEITLHDGNTVVGELLSVDDDGYRLRFGGMEVLITYPSVRGIDIVVEDALLEEMRPGDMRPRSFTAPEMHDGDNRSASTPPPYETRPAPRPPAFEPAPTPAPAPRVQTPSRPMPETRSAPPPPRVERRPPVPNRDQEARTAIPRKPRSAGGGLMVTGFVLLGIGGTAALASTVFYDDDDVYTLEDPDGAPAITAAGTIVAGTGAALAITGIILKSISGARRRRWERQYGDASDSFFPGGLQVAPSVSPDGAGGLTVMGRF